jgi:hypothetical protein
MTFSERMKDFLDQGVAASKEFALKAGAKAQDLGEQGVLMVEIKRLEGQAQKLLTRLGNEAYKAFAERNQDSLDKNDPETASLLTDLGKIRESIEQKETELRNKRS